jgi:hypothetical protein
MTITLEAQLAELATLGLALEPDASIADVLAMWGREAYEERPFDLLLFVLGVDVPRAPHGRTLSQRVWDFDTECVYGPGAYVKIVDHLVRLADAASRVTEIADDLKRGAKSGSLEYVLDGTRRRIEVRIDDDWADLSAVRRVMADLESGGRRFYARDNGQAMVLVYVDEASAARLAQLCGSALRAARMSHEDFWRIIGRRGPSDDLSAVYRGLELDADKRELASWVHAYRLALARVDLRTACRIRSGRNDAETFDGFCAWLLLQGEATVAIAVRELDALPPSPPHYSLYGSFLRWLDEQLGPRAEVEIPGRDRWAPDWSRATVPKTLAELRARYPRLIAGPDDDTLIAALRTAERNFTATAHATAARPRARHAKFGEGTVVSENGNKLEIEFASGRKLLDRRFVELLE